jgi:hypothetical protein
MLTAATKHANLPEPAIGQTGQNPGSVGFDDEGFMSEEELGDPGASLTQDDKIYLAMK